MAGRLKDEIKQTNPFKSLEQEAALNLLKSCQVVTEMSEQLFKEFGLSATQYNVLRILRGVGACESKKGVACREIGDRMITRDPDMTRLLDRLEKRGLIIRQRDADDRRVVKTSITCEGQRILKELDEPILKLHKKQLSHMGPAKLQQLIDLLEEVRQMEI